MSGPTKTQVIVVGGSLVGLSTALFLAHWKVPVILLERHRSSSVHPRAIGYTTRTIEVLKTVDVPSRLPHTQWTGGPPRRVVVESLAGPWRQEQAWTKDAGPQTPGKPSGPPPKDFTAYSSVVGIATAQDKVEPILRSRATELGADLRLGQTVTNWSQDEGGVKVTAVDGDGKETTFRAEYMVACDGARSPIRTQLGIERQGVGFIRSLRSILVHCPALDKYLESGYSQFQIEGRDDGFEAFMTTYRDGRWALMWNDDSDVQMSEATQRDWIRKAVGSDIPDDDIQLIATGQWELGGLIADSFSSGRVFLAGDAAHQLPPNRGGYGANTGIADAHNIAWKLAAVLTGTSRPELLETYDAERRPVAQIRHDQIFLRDDYRRFVQEREWAGKNSEIIDELAMELGQLYRSGGFIGADASLPDAKRPDEWLGQPGTRASHVPLRRGDEVLSTLDWFGTGWVLVAQNISWGSIVSDAADKVGVSCLFLEIGGGVEEVQTGSFETAYGLGHSGAVLVRPDGHIAWKTVEEPQDARKVLEEALGNASYAAKYMA